MTLGVDDISARFAVMWRNFSADANGLRIETAFDEIPFTLQAAMLPAVITFPGGATYNYDQYGETIVGETRTYRAVLHVATMGNEETGKPGVEQYIQRVRNYFAARPGMEDDTQAQPRTVVAMCRLINDEGYIFAQYPIGGLDRNGQPMLGFFHAVAFNFEVETIYQITYKD